MTLRIVELLENIKQWDEHPVIKMNYLFNLFKITHESNMKSAIADEILEEIDVTMSEFPIGNSTNIHLQQIKTTLTTYKNG